MDSNIKKNYLYNSCYQILAIIIPLVTTPYISHILGPEKIGVYSYRMSIAQYFVIFSMLGINNYGNRTCAAVRDDREKLSTTFSEIYVCQLFMSIICGLSYVILSLSQQGEQRLISILLTIYVCSAIFDINWFFYSVEEFKITTIRNTVVKIITVLLLFIVVKEQSDLWKYTIMMSVGTLVGVVAFWPLLKQWISLNDIKIRNVTRHIKPILILFIPVIAVSLYRYMDKIMLGTLSSMTETGYYENAEKFINMPLGFINSLGIVMLPRMSNLTVKKEEKRINNLIEKSMLFVSFLSCAMSFGIAAVSGSIVAVFMSIEFKRCISLIMILSPTMIFFSVANVIRTQYLIPRKKDKSYIISVFMGALINLIINYMLIPKWQSLGAAIGTVVAEFTVCFIQVLMVKKELNIKKYILHGIPFLGIGFIMFIVVYGIGQVIGIPVMAFIVQLVVGIIIYCLLSVLYLRLIDKDLFYSIKGRIFSKL